MKETIHPRHSPLIARLPMELRHLDPRRVFLAAQVRQHREVFVVPGAEWRMLGSMGKCMEHMWKMYGTNMDNVLKNMGKITFEREHQLTIVEGTNSEKPDIS